MKNILVFICFISLISCHQKKNDTILTNNEAFQLASQNLRKQIISFEKLTLLDTIRSIYLISVGQRFLNKEENIEQDVVLSLQSSGRHNNRYDGYNNYVLYFQKERRSINIFNERYLLNLLEYRDVQDDIILIFEGINKDSNKNGKYDYDDIKSLFEYSINQGKLNEIFKPYNHLILYSVLPETKDLIVLYGIDRDSNGVFEAKDEPSHYIEYNFDTDKKLKIVDDSLANKIQVILDGKK